MLLSHLKIQFIDLLKDEYPATEIESFFHLLTEEYLGMRRIDVALNAGYEVSEENKLQFEKALERLKDHEPVQYIIGETEFYGMKFKVNRNVLIPRPETEELVDWILKDHKEPKSGLKILDVGTGSGCIAISMAKEIANCKITALDISPKALELARINAEENEVDIEFQEVDILQKEKLNDLYDIIVSNPPYVREIEKQEMHKNVLNHEPVQALYVEDTNALVFYEKIAALAKDSLRENGVLYFEINQYLANETKSMLENLGFEAELKKDIFENYRMLKAKRKKHV